MMFRRITERFTQRFPTYSLHSDMCNILLPRTPSHDSDGCNSTPTRTRSVLRSGGICIHAGVARRGQAGVSHLESLAGKECLDLGLELHLPPGKSIVNHQSSRTRISCLQAPRHKVMQSYNIRHPCLSDTLVVPALDSELMSSRETCVMGC